MKKHEKKPKRKGNRENKVFFEVKRRKNNFAEV